MQRRGEPVGREGEKSDCMGWEKRRSTCGEISLSRTFLSLNNFHGKNRLDGSETLGVLHSVVWCRIINSKQKCSLVNHQNYHKSCEQEQIIHDEASALKRAMHGPTR